MTELDVYRPNGAVQPVAAGPPPVDSWVPVAREIFYLAEQIAGTEFVPERLRNRPAAVAAAMMAGRELGLPPMASLKHMQIVEGTPALSSEMAGALVQSLGHSIRWGERTNTSCTVHGKRIGEKEWTTVTYTIQDARQAKLLDPGKSGKYRFGWTNNPRRQLIARARAELCHTVFPDCINGVPIKEEVEDAGGYDNNSETVPDGGGELPPIVDAPSTAQRRSGRGVTGKARQKAPEPQPQEPQSTEATSPAPAGPPLPGETGYEDAPSANEPTGKPENSQPAAMATPKQVTAIVAILGKYGIKDRVGRLDVTKRIAQRAGHDVSAVESSKDLTRAAASAVIDALTEADGAVDSGALTFDKFLEDLIVETGSPDTDPWTGEIASTTREGER